MNVIKNDPFRIRIGEEIERILKSQMRFDPVGNAHGFDLAGYIDVNDVRKTLVLHTVPNAGANVGTLAERLETRFAPEIMIYIVSAGATVNSTDAGILLGCHILDTGGDVLDYSRSHTYGAMDQFSQSGAAQRLRSSNAGFSIANIGTAAQTQTHVATVCSEPGFADSVEIGAVAAHQQTAAMFRGNQADLRPVFCLAADEPDEPEQSDEVVRTTAYALFLFLRFCEARFLSQRGGVNRP
ncbi:MAG: hypothetical protein AAFQ21_08415 [Pseudomonadota bacterium]